MLKKVKKINKTNIKNKMKKAKNSKKFKPVLAVGCMVAVIMLISTSILISNHKAFVQLNAAMEEVYITPYNENNLLVKKQTLNNMEEEIEQHIKEFDTWYSGNIGLNEENLAKKEELLKSQKSQEDKLNEVKQIFLDDVSIKNKNLKKSIDKLISKDIEYNKNEKKVLNEVKNSYNELKEDVELKVALDNYEKLKTFKTKLNNNINVAKKRIEKEEKAKQEAKEKAEQEAKEKAEQEEAAKNNDSLKNNTSNSSSSSNNTASADGNFDRSFANSVYNAINSYRSALGLPAYSYNSAKQGCVDTEAKAYASTSNPHNYLCQPISAENAAYAYNGFYSPTDIVDAWKQDEPHHRPLKSTSYTSVAVSAYRSGNYIYIEACFW